MSDQDVELQRRLQQAKEKGQFQIYYIDIDDLNDLEILEKRQNLSKGELSSLVFAKRTRQAFLTDDQRARNLACLCMASEMVQTTTQLFGWLFYVGLLSNSDKEAVIKEHIVFKRPLRKYFEEMYVKALECKLAHSAR